MCVQKATLTCLSRRGASLTPDHVTWRAQSGGRVKELANGTLRHIGTEGTPGVGAVVVLRAVISFRGNKSGVFSARSVDV